MRDVIERVLEKKNEAEAMAADAYLEIVPDANDMFIDQTDKKREPTPSPRKIDQKVGKKKPSAPRKIDRKDKKKEPPPSRKSQLNIDDSVWKDERTHYEKSSSRVGPEFQVSTLPSAGAYASTNKHPDALCGGAM